MVERARSWIVRNAVVLSIVGSILLQTGTWVWWASKIDSRIVAVERWQDERRPVVDNMPVLREQFLLQMKILERIESGQKDLNEKLWNHIVGGKQP